MATLFLACARFGYDELSWLSTDPDASSLGGSAGLGSGGEGPTGEGGGAGGLAGGAGAASSEAGTSGSGGNDGGSERDGGAAGAGGLAADSGPPQATCADGVLNQGETLVDCGGASCAPCPCTFGTAELMGNPNLAGNDVFAVSLSSDARTLCIGGSIQGGSRPIGVTTRPNRGDSFAFASLLSAPVNSSPAVEGTPFLSRDELSLFFVSQRFGGQGDRDLYAATRASTGGSFDTLVTLGNLNSAQRDHAPWLSSDALTIYFASRRASVSDDLWRSTRSSQGVDFPSPVPVSELNSNGDDTGITFSDDGLVVYFASDRASGLGGMDLYRAARARLTDPFSAPELVPSLNTAADDAAPQLTLDGQELFFVSDRNGGDSQLFRASLASCP